MTALTTRILSKKNCRFELLTRNAEFCGLGRIWIGDVLVRSGRLPLRPYFQTFSGLELARLDLQQVSQGEEEIRIEMRAAFRSLETKPMRDHSFDPIHELGDWDEDIEAGSGVLSLVLRPSSDTFNGVHCDGFSYHYEYSSTDTRLFFILDKASWELGGDIVGATAYSQSSCSTPVATFDHETRFSTEGILFFLAEAGDQNPVMTHNLPRWASHGSFDFQYKQNKTLIGVFEHVDLIRSVVHREAGKAELKCFDKHIFDQTLEYSTVPKKILLNSEAKTEVGQKNLWTWIQDEVYERARSEFGLREEPLTPRLSQNFWLDFSVEDYERDLLPAAINLGIKQLFVDNLNQSDLTCGYPAPSGSNMCAGHEYELAPELGGPQKVREFVAKCREHGIEPYSWTNNDQSLASPISRDSTKQDWFVKMEDARLKYGGAYTNVFSILNFKKEEPRRYWIESLKTNKAQSGLSGYLFDSFYNLGFMPVDYSGMNPTTQWRELLQAFKELQDAGIHFLIESFGPFGQVQHGCPTSYNLENLFACYKIGLGSGYTTIPGGTEVRQARAEEAGLLFRILAHMTDPGIPLFVDGERIDGLWTDAHRQALAAFHTHREFMYRRYLQEDDASVIWHDRTGTRATIWNFVDREVELEGWRRVLDVTENRVLSEPVLQSRRVYIVEGGKLPRRIAKL